MSEEWPVNKSTNKMPSNSTTVGGLGGAGVGAAILWLITAFTGTTIPPEAAAVLGSLLGNLIGYFFEGGRKA